MKQKFFVMLQVTIILALIGVMLGSGSAEVDKTRYKLSEKNANVNYNIDTECQGIYVFLQISEYMTKDASPWPVTSGPMGFLTIEIWNWCDGSEQFGYAPIVFDPNDPNSSFEISENLCSAFAKGKGTLEWEDPDNEQPITEEVTIIMTWKGESSVSSSHNNFRSKYENIRINTHLSGTFRHGSATGLIKGETFEIQVEAPFYPPYPYYPYGYYGPTSIGKSKTGFIMIEKR